MALEVVSFLALDAIVASSRFSDASRVLLDMHVQRKGIAVRLEFTFVG